MNILINKIAYQILDVMNKKKPENKSQTTPLKILNISCPHFSECSGCEIAENVANPPIFTEAKAYFAKKGIHDLNLIVGNVNAWRYRAKLVVRGSSQNPQIGLYKKGTHTVLDIPFCQVHHPNINKAITIIKKFIRDKKIEPYNETTKTGLLRYLQLVVDRQSGKIQLTFVLNSEGEKDLEKWNLPENIWHSIWLNFNKTKTNTIFGANWASIKGPPLIFERIGDTEVCFHPASFAQSNLELFEKMLDSIYDQIPNNSKVVEYYAGVGVIGLKIASKCHTVVCSEIIPQAEICFLEAKQKLDPNIAKKISFYVGPSEKQLLLMDDKDLVIVDPPRKGVDKELLKTIIAKSNIKILIYISCGFDAFCRDCDLILASNEWTIKKIEPYLFFPGSNHLEILAIFERT